MHIFTSLLCLLFLAKGGALPADGTIRRRALRDIKRGGSEGKQAAKPAAAAKRKSFFERTKTDHETLAKRLKIVQSDNSALQERVSDLESQNRMLRSTQRAPALGEDNPCYGLPSAEMIDCYLAAQLEPGGSLAHAWDAAHRQDGFSWLGLGWLAGKGFHQVEHLMYRACVQMFFGQVFKLYGRLHGVALFGHIIDLGRRNATDDEHVSAATETAATAAYAAAAAAEAAETRREARATHVEAMLDRVLASTERRGVAGALLPESVERALLGNCLLLLLQIIEDLTHALRFGLFGQHFRLTFVNEGGDPTEAAASAGVAMPSSPRDHGWISDEAVAASATRLLRVHPGPTWVPLSVRRHLFELVVRLVLEVGKPASQRASEPASQRASEHNPTESPHGARLSLRAI